MTVEYIVLGAILIIMGAVQTWLRHGPGAKDLDRAGRSERPATENGTSQEAGSEAGRGGGPVRGGVRSGRVWESWTAILGVVSIALGIVLVVLGVMGR
jgi:hypothetical protein